MPKPVPSWEPIERDMAFEHRQREDGRPVGPVMATGAAFSCPCPTVQIVEQHPVKGSRRFLVHTLFPFRRTDRRFPPVECVTLSKARRIAFARLRFLGGGAPVAPSTVGGIELCRGGEHIGLEVTR